MMVPRRSHLYRVNRPPTSWQRRCRSRLSEWAESIFPSAAKNLVVEVSRPDGSKFILRAENMSDHNLAKTTSQLSVFLGR